ncbi:uncharacterized protein MYCFIDRAFT_177812 [Pseudocercospora fijiensis CIRAD86]|uniref:Uncharacterized protein n=1 Tax=Pseudocercospora fijiensis (strain CIRAD86) TaxID=383855 RepID=M3ANY8_PSEFD|nr:uncharacterized protein MYCFIDRAFT_177812 [Pseudocercospora fijiensis CIRAD86]EME79167.1 hypothetical protein MYCFIDRAFT_177812 [Pseudocercospora fijiensis CIRAD86]
MIFWSRCRLNFESERADRADMELNIRGKNAVLARSRWRNCKTTRALMVVGDMPQNCASEGKYSSEGGAKTRYGWKSGSSHED